MAKENMQADGSLVLGITNLKREMARLGSSSPYGFSTFTCTRNWCFIGAEGRVFVTSSYSALRGGEDRFHELYSRAPKASRRRSEEW